MTLTFSPLKLIIAAVLGTAAGAVVYFVANHSEPDNDRRKQACGGSHGE